MRQNSFLPIAILALNAGDLRHERWVLENFGITACKRLDGVYKGVKETSWLVPVTSVAERNRVIQVAKTYNQESVLFSGIDRTTSLHYLVDDRQELLGVLTAVSEEFAKQQDGYTYDPESGQYWAIV